MRLYCAEINGVPAKIIGLVTKYISWCIIMTVKPNGGIYNECLSDNYRFGLRPWT